MNKATKPIMRKMQSQGAGDVRRRLVWSVLPFLVAALMAAVALGTIVSMARAAQASQTNSTPGTADGGNITRSVDFTTIEFDAGSTITDVVAAVTFEKSNGSSCDAYTGGNVYYQEIYFLLRSPAGTQIVLVEDQANTGGSGQGPTYTDSDPYVGEVTVTFDDDAGAGVQNTVPVSGTFQPVEALSAFDGQDPLGTWTLTVGDSNSFDPLCFSEFTLTINAAEPPTPQPPTVNDQTFSVPENSPDGTSVGTVVADDPDGTKLLFAIDPVDIFDIVANTGEITVIDGSQLDADTPPTFYTRTVTVTDTDALTDSAVITITVTNANEGPTAVDDTYATDEDTALTVNDVNGVLANDSDPEDDPLSVTDFDTPSANGATVTVNSNGSFTYDPTSAPTLQALDAGDTLTDTFGYTMQEAGGGLTDTATVSVTVSGVNDPPDAVDDAATTSEETPVTISVLTNDSDPENHSLSVSGVGTPDNGTANIVGDTVEYTPAAGFVGTDVFTYTVSDGNGGFGTANIEVTVENTPPTLSNVTVTPSSIDENDTATLTGNMSDQGLTDFTLEVNWGDGTPTEVFTYTAGTTSFSENHQYLDDNPTGTASDNNTIEVILKDDDGGSDTGSTTVTVNNLNPSLSNVAATSPVAEGAPTTLSGNIADTGTLDTFTLEVDWGDSSPVESFTYGAGTTSFSEAHQYPDNNTYSINVTLTDDDTGSDTAPTSVTTTNVAPRLSGVSATSVNENGATTLSGSINDPGSGDSFTLEVDWGDGTALQTFAYNAGTTSFNETHQYLDDDPTLTPSDLYTVTLTLTDDDLGSDNTTTNLTVNNVAPTVNAGPDQTVSKGSPTVSFNGSFTDPGTLDSHTIEWDFGDGNTITGTLTPNHTYPTTTAVYTVTLTVTDDDTGVSSDTLIVTVTNSPPEAVDDTYTTAEDTPLSVPAATGLLANDSDPDGDTLTAALDITPLNGTVAVNADGSFVYTPTLDFNGSDNFTYIVSDSDAFTDTAIVVINVTGENDPPVAVDDTATTVQNTAVTIAVLDNDSDPENNLLTVTAVGTPANGSATTDGTTARYTPVAGFTGTDVFTYTVSDGNGGTDTANVTVTVVEKLEVYLPVVVNNFVAAPDLIVTDVRGSSDNIEVTIRNQGNAPVVDAFWVDFYIDPSPVPSSANELWQDVSSQGIVWGVTVPLAVGEELTLVYSTEPGAPNTYYAPEFSYYTGSLPVGTPIYAQVDSAHIDTTYGAVMEDHEITGGPYNNVSDAATATARIEGLSTPDTADTPIPSSDLALPPRPQLGHRGEEN